VNILAKLYGYLLNKEIDPMTNILVTIGAYEALYCSIFGILNPGDEVIMIEPFYEPYLSIIRMAGGVPVSVALKSINQFDDRKMIPYKKLNLRAINESTEMNSCRKWVLDFGELESKFNSKTRLVIVNTPLNPLGKV